MRHISVLLSLLLMTCSLCFAGEWPQFLGPERNGFSPERGINRNWRATPPKMLWQTGMNDHGYAGPSAAAGKIFIVDHQGNQDIVRALDWNTGRKVWEFRYPDAPNDNYGFTRCTPTVANGKVYTISRLGKVLCLDARSGKKLWDRYLVKDFHGVKPNWDYSMSVLVDGNKAIVCPGGRNAAVAALDTGSGRTIWQGGGSDFPGYATPTVATINRVRQYVVFTGKSLIGVDAGNGRLLWSTPWLTGCDVNAATPIVSGNTILITSDYGHGCELMEINGNTPHVRWTSKAIQSHFSTPILAGGYFFSTTDPNKLVCLEMQTGKVRWEQPGFEKGGQMAADGTLIAFEGSSGNLVMVKLTPDRYQEISRFRPLGGQSWTAPIIADGKLIIRNQRTLACYNIR